MEPVKRALVLIGCPRGQDGPSGLMARYLVQGFSRLSVATRREPVSDAVASDSRMEELLWGVDRADMVVLISPVWMQGLPAQVLELFSEITRRRDSVRSIRSRSFGAVLLSRMPLDGGCGPALSVCRLFSRRAGFFWRGGLRLPQTEAFLPWLTALRAPALSSAMSIAAGCWTENHPVAGSAVRLMSRPILPWPAYLLAQSVGVLRRARRQGARDSLELRPLGR